MPDTARYFWQRQAQWESVHKSNAKRCQKCGCLTPHPGIECSLIKVRLQWSAKFQYDRLDPWNWPPLDIYNDQHWIHDLEAQDYWTSTSSDLDSHH